jgi:hypothetical protein
MAGKSVRERIKGGLSAGFAGAFVGAGAGLPSLWFENPTAGIALTLVMVGFFLIAYAVMRRYADVRTWRW